jgi:hypothetical protein
MKRENLIGEVCTAEEGKRFGLDESVVAVKEEVLDLCT